MTYSHFTSKAGAETLVLETGQWVYEVDMKFSLDAHEPKARLSTASDKTKTVITAELLFPAQVNLEDIDFKSISLEYLGKMVWPVAGSEQLAPGKLILQFDREDLAALLDGTKVDDVILALSGQGSGFSFTAKGLFSLSLIESEEKKEDKSAQAVSVRISGDSEILIPAEGEIKHFYSAAVSDENGELLADEAIRWQLLEAVEGVLFDDVTVVLVVSSNASPGCVTLVAHASSDPDVFSELVIALIKEDQPAQEKPEEPEPEFVDDVEAEAEEEQQDSKGADGLIEDDGSVDAEGGKEDLSVNELNMAED